MKAWLSGARAWLRAPVEGEFRRGLRALHATDEHHQERLREVASLGLAKPTEGTVVRIAQRYRDAAQDAQSGRWKWLRMGFLLFIAAAALCIALIVYLLHALYQLELPTQLFALSFGTIAAITALFALSAYWLSRLHAFGLLFYLQYAVYLVSSASIAGAIEGVARKHISEKLAFGMAFGSAGAMCGGAIVALVALYRLTPAQRIYVRIRRGFPELAAAARLIDSATSARSASASSMADRGRVLEAVEDAIFVIEHELSPSRKSGVGPADKALATETWRIAAGFRKLQVFYLLHCDPQGHEVRDTIIKSAIAVGTPDWNEISKLDRRPSLWERIRSPLLASLPVLGSYALAGFVIWFAFSGPKTVLASFDALFKPAIILSALSVCLAALRTVTEPPK